MRDLATPPLDNKVNGSARMALQHGPSSRLPMTSSLGAKTIRLLVMATVLSGVACNAVFGLDELHTADRVDDGGTTDAKKTEKTIDSAEREGDSGLVDVALEGPTAAQDSSDGSADVTAETDSSGSSDASIDNGHGSGDVDSSSRGNADASDASTDGAVGGRCESNANCASQKCVENVCCDMPCIGPCTSCLATNTGKANGICAPVMAGTDPHNSCTVDDVRMCGNDGTCDGNGTCRKYGTSAVCQTESWTAIRARAAINHAVLDRSAVRSEAKVLAVKAEQGVIQQVEELHTKLDSRFFAEVLAPMERQGKVLKDREIDVLNPRPGATTWSGIRISTQFKPIPGKGVLIQPLRPVATRNVAWLTQIAVWRLGTRCRVPDAPRTSIEERVCALDR